MEIKLMRTDEGWIPCDKNAIKWEKKYKLTEKSILVWEDPNTRSLAQNRLYHKWVKEISDDTGYTIDELYYEYKKDFLKPIFEREKASYRLMIESVRNVHRAGLKKEAASLINDIIGLTSTRDASVKEFSEYLHCIDMKVAGIVELTRPPEKWLEKAMSEYDKLPKK